MTAINTNVKSLIAQQSLTVNNRSLSKAMEQLSTGKRINSAADDAAGLAISNKMTAQVRGLNQAVRNANDAISMVQTAEGALNEVTNMLQRMRELAVQSVNGTNSDADRTSLDQEYDQLFTEIARISDKTTWNGLDLMGDGASATSGQTNFQVGNAASDTVSVTFQDVSQLNGMTDVSGGSVSTVALATSSITHIDNAISAVDAYRSTLGAMVNRLNYAADNLTNVATNTSASRSRILDTDYAATTTELARTQIIQQAATAMLAQANQSPSSVLSLLQQ
ncbi:flagellin [Limnohabitans sp. Rim8]|uniref:flagellin N-terminal helical domain-containing protein n=1 Tax=Limnohabitans sp. Rim8 TaxID=1100718 RepID=UPI0025FE6BBA|nr:flagellin [Limnohabitans sp. Rim8]